MLTEAGLGAGQDERIAHSEESDKRRQRGQRPLPPGKGPSHRWHARAQHQTNGVNNILILMLGCSGLQNWKRRVLHGDQERHESPNLHHRIAFIWTLDLLAFRSRRAKESALQPGPLWHTLTIISPHMRDSEIEPGQPEKAAVVRASGRGRR